MDPWRKSAIWKIIHYLEKHDFRNAKPYCLQAEDELKVILKKIKLEDRGKVKPLAEFIDRVRTDQQVDVQSAYVLFERYIIPFLIEEERSRQKKENGGKESHRSSYSDGTVQVSHGHSENKRTLRRGPAELAHAFLNIYSSGLWEAAFKELKGMTRSEPLSLACLLEIVQKAFASNDMEAKQQLQLAEEYALLIVKGEQLRHVKPKFSSNARVNDFLQRYRYEHADLATGRLQKNLLEVIQGRLQKDYNVSIYKGSSLEQFIIECTEVTWLMCVEDPPINVVHIVEATKPDRDMYEMKYGQKTNTVVWPALQLLGSSTILAKGVAWCK